LFAEPFPALQGHSHRSDSLAITGSDMIPRNEQAGIAWIM
jgi:hypothetical protein